LSTETINRWDIMLLKKEKSVPHLILTIFVRDFRISRISRSSCHKRRRIR
jgi:hypothetical protein